MKFYGHHIPYSFKNKSKYAKSETRDLRIQKREIAHEQMQICKSRSTLLTENYWYGFNYFIENKNLNIVYPPKIHII